MNTPVSPKVLAATIGAVLVGAVLAAIQQLAGDAEFIAALPAWLQPFVPALIAALAAFLGGYSRRDHLRDVGQAVVTDTNVPAAVNAPAVDLEDGFDDDQPLGERPAL